MKNRQVVIELLPDRIDVVVLEGSRRADFRRVPITAPSDACEWAKTVRRSAATLKNLVEELNLAGCGAIVLYRSPTQAVELASYPSTSPSQALEAATLGCADSLPYSAMSAVCEATVLGRDAAGEARQTHVLVTAERGDVAEAIVELIQGADLKFVSATPLDAAVTARLVTGALRGRGEHQGTLYVGEGTSAFVITGGGRLLFSRRIDLGLETLAQSLTRPIRAGGGDDPIELDIDAARSLLHTHGIPNRETIVHQAPQLSGAQVIPLIQPVLQRFIVELRQSLRFGLDDEERGRLTISVTGPGSALPGLAALVSEELEIEATADERYAAYDFSKRAVDGSELTDALLERNVLRRLNLLPFELARQRRVSRLRRWLWTGAAAALALIVGDGFRYHHMLTDARRHADVAASRLADIEALHTTGEKLAGALRAMSELEQRIIDEIGLRVDYRACMHEVSRITPETIRFTSIAFHRFEERTIGTVTGFAFPPAGGDGRTDLEDFIQALRDSPMFENIELGNMSIDAAGDFQGQRFETTFIAIGVPSDGDEVGRFVLARRGGTE